jgi:hypothetical protein
VVLGGDSPEDLLLADPVVGEIDRLRGLARSSGLAPEQVMGKLSGGPLTGPAQVAGASSAARLALT